MFCRKCQREMPQDALYCPYCGVSLNANKTSRKPRTRPNGTGTAFKRGKTWTARVVVGWRMVNSKAVPVYRSKGGFATKRAALEYCVILKQDMPRKKAPTLITYWNTYESGEYEKLSKSKQTAYKGAWKKLSALHYRPVDQITVSEMREAVSAVASTFYTVRDCKTVLTKLFELAGADGYCNKDIPSYIVLPKLNEKERKAFTPDEQTALWKLYESGDKRAAIPLLMIYTGMMPGEAQILKVESINLDILEIHGVGMKTKVRKETPIIIPKDILPLVQDLIANAQTNGFIWPQNENKWYTDYYAALQAAGCRKLEPYSCRHTTATRLAITESIAPQTIQKMMRWSTSKMLDRYAHPDGKDVHNAANSIQK